MAGQFGTRTEVMDAAGRQVFAVRDEIHAELGKLRGQLAPLETTWRGEASLAFGQLMIRWNDNAERINRSLQAIGESLGVSSAQYRASEDEVATSQSQILRALG